VLTLTDVTAEHEAQLRAEASERRLQQILDAVDASVFTKDREGRYTFVNQSFVDEAGAPAASILGRRAGDLAGERAGTGAQRGSSDVVAAERQDERLFETGEPVTDVLRGNGRAYLTTKRPLRDHAGRIDGMVGVSTNVTPQLRAAEAQAIANAVVESSTDGIVTVDRDLLVTAINSAAARNQPLPAAELIGRSYFEVFDVGEERPSVEQRLRGVLEGGEVEMEYRPVRGDTDRVYAVRAFPIRAEDGSILGGAVVGRDITAARAAEVHRRNLERQVEHMQRLEGLGQLAGGVAHDFNNLLGAIHLTAEVLAGSLPAGSDERAQAASIVAITTRAAAFTQQLLVFARNDSAPLHRVDVNAAVRNADGLLARTLGAQVERVIELAPGQVFVNADPSRLEQVVINLAINARDAMPEGGRLHIATTVVDLTEEEHGIFHTRQPGPHVVISVTDEGIGMDEQTRQQAFDPFFTTKPRGQGTGLGLSTAYGVASQSGGGAWIYSEPGRGTVVKVALPLVEAPARSAAPRPAAAPEGLGQRVAVVEDEAALGEVARRILSRAGYHVEVYLDGPSLLAALDGESADAPQLLLTDVVLPRMPGPDLADELTRRHPQVRVLYMTGYTAGLVDRRLGEADVLDKPFTSATLLDAVARALEPARPAPPPPPRRD
jgi:PAS domain S-box-containing protein